MNKWYWKLLAVVVTVLFFFIVASIVTGLFSLLIPLMGPLLLILLVVWLIRPQAVKRKLLKTDYKYYKSVTAVIPVFSV